MNEADLRAAVSAAIIQGGWDDWTDCDCENADPWEWHRCPTCPDGKAPCACSGIPWVNDKTWERMRPWLAALIAPEAQA